MDEFQSFALFLGRALAAKLLSKVLLVKGCICSALMSESVVCSRSPSPGNPVHPEAPITSSCYLPEPEVESIHGRQRIFRFRRSCAVASSPAGHASDCHHSTFHCESQHAAMFITASYMFLAWVLGLVTYPFPYVAFPYDCCTCSML